MKILFILDLYKPHIGGVEILFENIIDGLLEKGHDVVVLTSRFRADISAYEKVSERFEICRVGHNRYDFMLYCLRKGIALAKQCDVIHATTYNAAIPASIIAQISGKPVILTVHEIFGKLWYRFIGWKGFFFKLFESFIFLFPYNRYICVSNYTKNSIRLAFGLADEKLRTVYNGIDYTLWNPSNFTTYPEIRKKLGGDSHFLWLFFGRPGISKGLEYYVRAIPGIVARIPNFHALLLVSEGANNPATYIRNLVTELGISEHATFMPSVPYRELGNYILASDFVIVPSLAEGFGFAAVEACALEKELIVTNTAALPEVVSGKIRFIEPSNPNDIIQAVLDIQKGTYENIPEKRFLWNDNLEKTLQIYQEVLWE